MTLDSEHRSARAQEALEMVEVVEHARSKPYRSAMTAGVTTFLVSAAYLAWCPWFAFDYDNFRGDVVVGALVFDQVTLLGSDPYTTIASACYCTAWLACMTCVRVTRTDETGVAA